MLGCLRFGLDLGGKLWHSPLQMTARLRLYKVLSVGREACSGGLYTYPAPKKGKPGEWTDLVSHPAVCARGYHLVTAEHVPHWVTSYRSQEIWEAEGRGRPSVEENWNAIYKRAYPQARLLRRVLSTKQLGKMILGPKCPCGCGNSSRVNMYVAIPEFLKNYEKANPKGAKRKQGRKK